MRTLLIDDAVKAQIEIAIAEARKHPRPLDEIMATRHDVSGGTLKLSDRRPDLKPRPGVGVEIPVGFLAAISFEQQPVGLCRHLSVSVDGAPGAMPHPVAIMAIAKEFGMPVEIDELKGVQGAAFWVEEFKPEQYAVNLVLPELAQ
jgi:hypothetical protein